MKPLPMSSDDSELASTALQEALKKKRQKLAQTRLGEEPDPDELLQGKAPGEK